MTDLNVKFEEPESYPFDIHVGDERLTVEPTVGGLTGQQLSLLSQLRAENHCWYEVYPVSPKGPAEYCIEPREDWSSYCEQHAYQVAREQPVGPTYDEYDSYRDREYE